VARYVVPEIKRLYRWLAQIAEICDRERAVFERAGQAVMAKIMETTRPRQRFR